jgi:hypothetical protein
MTARKVVIPRPGGYERLTFEPLVNPTPKAGEVVVATEAIGVNYADCVIRMGLYASAKEFVGWPITPGFEFADTSSSRCPRGSSPRRPRGSPPCSSPLTARSSSWRTHARARTSSSTRQRGAMALDQVADAHRAIESGTTVGKLVLVP